MPLSFNPPLLNSANPWASSQDQLRQLYLCPYTGAVTIRTTLLDGFGHDDAIHQYTYFDARTNAPMPERSPNANSSLNTLGYSPTPLDEYLDIVQSITSSHRHGSFQKPFIISVTGTPEEIVECHRRIAAHARTNALAVLMEVNLSCPNISGRPPPSYNSTALQDYLSALQRARSTDRGAPHVPIGIKTSPFTYHNQFVAVIDALLATTRGDAHCPVDFITATNTLGNCLVMAESDQELHFEPAVKSAADTGIGGLGGAAIHALSLGNVATFRRLLDEQPAIRHIEIIGVGGVSDSMGYGRMRSAGAAAVAVGTGLGREGVDIFEKISNGVAIAGSLLTRQNNA